MSGISASIRDLERKISDLDKRQLLLLNTIDRMTYILARAPYMQKLKCLNEVNNDTFSQSSIKLIFESYFDSSKDMVLYSQILGTDILPKVCVNIVFEYMPNIIILFSTTSLSRLYIEINNRKYEFIQSYYDVFVSIGESESDYIEYTGVVSLINIITKIITNIVYDNDHEKLLKQINELCSGQIIVKNITLFLELMCCILFVKDHSKCKLDKKNVAEELRVPIIQNNVHEENDDEDEVKKTPTQIVRDDEDNDDEGNDDEGDEGDNGDENKDNDDDGDEDEGNDDENETTTKAYSCIIL